MFLWREQYNRSDWLSVDLTHLSGLIKDLKNSRCPIGCLKANYRSQGVDLASFFFFLKEIKACIVPFWCGPLSLRIAYNISVLLSVAQRWYSRHKKGSSLAFIHIHYPTYNDPVSYTHLTLPTSDLV